VNDNPFSSPLALMLLDNANIGMQIDISAGPMLFLGKWFEKKKQREHVPPDEEH